MTAASVLVDPDVKLEENSSSDQRSNLSHGLGDDEIESTLLAVKIMSRDFAASCRCQESRLRS